MVLSVVILVYVVYLHFYQQGGVIFGHCIEYGAIDRQAVTVLFIAILTSIVLLIAMF